MDVTDAVFLQVADLADGIVDASLAHLLGVIAVGCKNVGKSLRNAGACKRDRRADLLRGGNGHDAGADRNRDPLFGSLLQKAVIEVIIKE